MAREPQDIYDDWYDRQVDKIDDYAWKVNNTEAPEKKLKIYDAVIEKAEQFAEECKRRDAEPEIYSPYAEEAEKLVSMYQKEKQDYLDNEYEQDLEDYAETLREIEEAMAENKRIQALHKAILKDLEDGAPVAVVFLKKKYADDDDALIQKAVDSLIKERKVTRSKIKGRIHIKLGAPAEEAVQSNTKPTRRPAQKKTNPFTIRPKTAIEEVVGTGEIVDVVYLGGTKPGTARKIVPLKIQGDKLLALDVAAGFNKYYFIEKIIYPVDSSKIQHPEKPVELVKYQQATPERVEDARAEQEKKKQERLGWFVIAGVLLLIGFALI